MGRFIRIVLLSIIMVFWAGNAALALDGPGNGKFTFVNLYKVDYQSGDAIGAGLKLKVLGNIYGTLNVEPYEATSDLKVQGGLVYLFPHEVLFFKFYGGIGAEFFRDTGFNDEYIVLGTHFLFFFSEMIYPWKQGEDPMYRYGLSFNY